jgi:two-component system, chemotaxis family, chemotaxis protein CheY
MQMIRQPGANANPYVAIIMLTGHSEKKRVMAARDAGVTEFLCKPISAKGLYQRIINVVANQRVIDADAKPSPASLPSMGELW